jgi:catechol 2,3-dioxygenase-like lactoylglutathione lyase family enzyme
MGRATRPAPRLFRVILPVSDIDEAAGFYAVLLGMPGQRVWLNRHYFDCAGTILACMQPPDDGEHGAFAPNPQHVYFSVDDLEAVHARARELGCRELTEIDRQAWGERSFYAYDPFGNPICVVDSGTLFTGD